MTRERWERLGPLIDAVLDQPPEQRHAYVAELSEGDAALAEELAQLISTSGEGETDKHGASIFEAAEHARSALMSGRVPDGAVSLGAQLQTSLGASYVVEREIGGGGMARVFVAEEPALGRKVVIKVLPPGMSEGISAERFAREIKLAASLQQANIVPVLTTGTAAGFPYYTMPYVEGRSLRDRLLREGALPVNEAIDILRDVARALAFAHGRGVIHRDIKPGNILLSDRTAVVTDFGIAKALGALREQTRAGATHNSVSDTGTIGTPAYMAPEQASGDPSLDHRADIYSFGCVAFELLTGKPPFVGAASHDIIAAHLRETPRRLNELRSEVPVAVAQLVASCLEKAPSRRPQSADDVLHALDEAAKQPMARVPRQTRRKTVTISTVVLVASMASVLAYYAARAKLACRTNPQALDAYEIGRLQLNARAITGAIKSFHDAIGLDSNFACAHAGLATALSFAPFFTDGSPFPLIDSSVVEARRALAIQGVLASWFKDSTASDAYVVLGKAHGYRGEWAASDSDIRHAIALENDNSQARETLARHYLLRGHPAVAIEEFKRASKFARTSPTLSIWLAYAFFLEGSPQSAIDETQRTTRIPSALSATANLGSLLNLALGRREDALFFAATALGSAMPNSPYVYAKIGDTATANDLIRKMENKKPRPWFTDVAKASVFLAKNDTASALTFLERSSNETGALWVFYIPLGDPAFDPVRKSPRFAKLLRKANIDTSVITHPRRGS
jgi:serine/threonine protein kinase